MKYDLTIYTPGREPVLHIKYLFRAFGWELNLHKIVRADDHECFHTHPANAWRLILRGGYIEEVFRVMNHDGPLTEKVWWRPGMFGRIRPEFEHRIAYLYEKASYTLWIRGPVVAPIKTRGC